MITNWHTNVSISRIVAWTVHWDQLNPHDSGIFVPARILRLLSLPNLLEFHGETGIFLVAQWYCCWIPIVVGQIPLRSWESLTNVSCKLWMTASKHGQLAKSSIDIATLLNLVEWPTVYLFSSSGHIAHFL